MDSRVRGKDEEGALQAIFIVMTGGGGPYPHNTENDKALVNEYIPLPSRRALCIMKPPIQGGFDWDWL